MQYPDPSGCKQYLHEGVDKYLIHGLTYAFKKQIQFPCDVFMRVLTNVFFSSPYISLSETNPISLQYLHFNFFDIVLDSYRVTWNDEEASRCNQVGWV
jgi:hypothetical protein